MAEQHHVKIPAHYNIYSGESGRELRVEFSTPSEGINQKTGILLLVPGFGGNIDSKVYKKMRETFADEFNLIVIQCDYFGSIFMQTPASIQTEDMTVFSEICTEEEIQQIQQSPSRLLSILASKTGELTVRASMNESIEEFNDMGYMQAIDLITAIELVKAIIHDNGFTYDESRVLGYGHSHGAYLLHIANRLAPKSFSYIIDNSAWLKPRYFFCDRLFYQPINQFMLIIKCEYLAKHLLSNQKCLHLQHLYREFENEAQILTFQGDDDDFVDHMQKEEIIHLIKNSRFQLITKKEIDNKKFKSNQHGLDADFLELFRFALQFENMGKCTRSLPLQYEVFIQEKRVKVDSSSGLPIFDFS